MNTRIGRHLFVSLVLLVGLISATVVSVSADGPGPIVEVTTYPIDEAWDIVIDAAEVTWVCGDEILRSADDGETWEVITPDDPRRTTFYTTDSDGEGGLWVWLVRLAEQGGWVVGSELAHFDGQVWEYFFPPKDVEYVVDIEVDHDGNVWFAVLYGEIGRYNPVRDEWTFWPNQTEWPQAKPSLVSVENELWTVGKMNPDRLQILIFDEENEEWVAKEKSMETGFRWTARAIAHDPMRGGLWVEYDKYDGHRFLSSHISFLDLETGEWVLYPAGPMDLYDVVSMTVDSNGLVWIGLDDWYRGLVIFDPAGSGRWGQVVGLWDGPPRQTWSLAANPDGDVWATIPNIVQMGITNWPQLWKVYLPEIRKGM